MFFLTKEVLDAWYPPEEFKLVAIYGPLGYGKSAYCFKVGVEILKEVYKVSNEKAWELLKQFIVFHPEQYFMKLDNITEYGLDRIPFLDWDDAGLWLYALEWNDPFILRVGKYMSVARTHLGGLKLSTPTLDFIFKKIRTFPNAITVSIIKSGSGYPYDKYRRIAKLYVQYYHIVKGYQVAALKRGGARVEDEFSCLMPDEFYKWYKPLRDSYEDMALNLMKEEWTKVRKQSKAMDLDDYPQLKMPELTLKGI